MQSSAHDDYLLVNKNAEAESWDANRTNDADRLEGDPHSRAFMVPP